MNNHNSNGVNNFYWAKALGYGVALWLAIFIAGSILFAGLNLTLGVWVMLLLAVIAGALAYFFGIEIDPQNPGQAFGYGLSFVVIGLLLDYFVSNALLPGVFGVWTYWLGYLFILFAPLTVAGVQNTTHHAV